VAKGQKRVLLVMASGTGKTYTAFQIIWRLWKSGQARRVLFLADRNILVDQTCNDDLKPFGAAMTKITGRRIDPSDEIDLSLYQAVSGTQIGLTATPKENRAHRRPENPHPAALRPDRRTEGAGARLRRQGGLCPGAG
jgi:type I site-specific restriction endonuclease